MAIYFNRELNFPGYSTSLVDGTIVRHLTEWHSKFAILAVTSKNETNNSDGSVSFFLDEGDLIEEATIHRSVVVFSMAWQSEREIIALGWMSGEVTTYNFAERRIYEQSSIHRSPVLVLKWNQTGTRLLTGDKTGLLVVWEVDELGKLYPIPTLQHRLRSAITHIALLDTELMTKGIPADKKPKSGANAPNSSVPDPIASFVATYEGR